MSVSLNTLWTNTYHFISAKISEGLTPMEKKVTMVAITYFALATLGYFIFSCLQYSMQSTPGESKKNPFAAKIKENVVRDTPRDLPEFNDEKTSIADTVIVTEKTPADGDIATENIQDDGEALSPYRMDDSSEELLGEVAHSNSPVQAHILVNLPAQNKDLKLEPNWINNHPNTPLHELGLNDYPKLKDFIQRHGDQLKCLNLKEYNNIDNDQLKELIILCPNLSHLFINSHKIDDSALSNLKGMPLTSVDFSGCGNLTDDALAHLEGMKLTSVAFSECGNLTDDALAHLEGMPLTSVNFSDCWHLTDAALVHLEGMKLTSVAFGGCKNLTDAALNALKT